MHKKNSHIWIAETMKLGIVLCIHTETTHPTRMKSIREINNNLNRGVKEGTMVHCLDQ